MNMMKRSKKTFEKDEELKQKTPTNKISDKKTSKSLSKLLQTEKDFKKINSDLKKALKKMKTLEDENFELSKQLGKK
jgi:hypothetical protein